MRPGCVIRAAILIGVGRLLGRRVWESSTLSIRGADNPRELTCPSNGKGQRSNTARTMKLPMVDVLLRVRAPKLAIKKASTTKTVSDKTGTGSGLKEASSRVNDSPAMSP